MMRDAICAGLVACPIGALCPVIARALLARRSIHKAGLSGPAHALVTILFAVACASLAFLRGITPWTVEVMALLAIMTTCALTDVLAWLIPNECMLACVGLHAVYLLVIGLIEGWSRASSQLLASLASLLIVTVPLVALILLMDAVLGAESMGGGDLKLFAVDALVFGWQRCILLVLLACLLGAVFGIAYRQHPAHEADDPSHGGFPFGPAITVATWLTAVWGSEIVSWYLTMLA